MKTGPLHRLLDTRRARMAVAVAVAVSACLTEGVCAADQAPKSLSIPVIAPVYWNGVNTPVTPEVEAAMPGFYADFTGQLSVNPYGDVYRHLELLTEGRCPVPGLVIRRDPAPSRGRRDRAWSRHRATSGRTREGAVDPAGMRLTPGAARRIERLDRLVSAAIGWRSAGAVTGRLDCVALRRPRRRHRGTRNSRPATGRTRGAQPLVMAAGTTTGPGLGMLAVKSPRRAGRTRRRPPAHPEREGATIGIAGWECRERTQHDHGETQCRESGHYAGCASRLAGSARRNGPPTQVVLPRESCKP